MEPRLLAILAHPETKEPLELDGSGEFLIARSAGVKFPIENGVPILVMDRAVPIAVDQSKPSTTSA